MSSLTFINFWVPPWTSTNKTGFRNMKSISYVEGRPANWRNFANLLISSPAIARWAPIPLRLIVGYGFMEHGFAKAARGFDAFPAIVQATGRSRTSFAGMAHHPVEILGGLAVLLGALVPLASIPMAIGAFGRDVHRASSLRLQLDQASGRNGRRRAVRAAGLRNRSPLPRLPGGPRPGRIRTSFCRAPFGGSHN